MLIAITLAASAVAAYGILVGALYTHQRQLLYKPDTSHPDPVRAGVPEVAVLSVPTSDGLALRAWYLPPAALDGFTALFLHGNAGHIGHRASRARALHALGWGVLMLEYRGYGDNPGSPTEAGLITDARAGLSALRAKGVRADRTLLWGESLGTSLAVWLGAENDVAAVLLEHPFTSVTEAAQGQYPYVPVRWLLKDRFDSLSRIPFVKAPILIMQGARDRLVPPEMGRALAAAAGGPVELWVAPEAGHDDLGPFGGTEQAAAFVARHTH